MTFTWTMTRDTLAPAPVPADEPTGNLDAASARSGGSLLDRTSILEEDCPPATSMPPPPGAGAVSSTERLFSRKTLLLPGHDFPVLARIEVRHLASQNTRSRAQILFVDLAPMVDHERLDAGDSVFGGI